ncbi:hypothetical protein [Streptomyces sp. NPDC001275]
MSAELINAEVWSGYGKHLIQRGAHLAEVDRIAWGPSGTGPGDDFLGDLAGQHAAHLARR